MKNTGFILANDLKKDRLKVKKLNKLGSSL